VLHATLTLMDDDVSEYENIFDGPLREVVWEGPEHHHVEKGSDWFWALGIITIAGAVTAILFGNVLFGVVILLGGMAMALVSAKKPRIVIFSVSTRGVRIGNELHPYSTIECFYLNEDHPHHAQLFLQSKQMFVPLLILPVPDDAVEDIEYILETRLPERHLEESLGQRILEFLGF